MTKSYALKIPNIGMRSADFFDPACFGLGDFTLRPIECSGKKHKCYVLKIPHSVFRTPHSSSFGTERFYSKAH